MKTASIGVILLMMGVAAQAEDTGPAARMGKNAVVLFSTDFESEAWQEPWDAARHGKNLRLVVPETTGRAAAHEGKALEVTVQKGGHYGMAPVFNFAKHAGYQPTEAYARYDVYFAEDWRGYSGKAPGWNGTEAAGWGGKPSDGTNGWSARGGMRAYEDGSCRMGYYTYHAEMKGQYGDNFNWDADVRTGRWHRIEQYCKINTPGKKDGILRAWVDGVLVLDKQDVMMRTVDTLRLKSYWINFYFGGKDTSEIERHAYMDNLLLAVPVQGE